MSDSARLRLPNLAAGQAQKHVTVNEAEAILDILVQASVLDFATAPAGGESDGDCYIVTATATDEFTGWEGRIAFMRDGEWFSILPGAGDGEGWRAWVQAEGKFYVYDGAGTWSVLTFGDASDVPFTPAGGISATDVQSAVEELDSEKQAALGFTPRPALAADRTYYVDATNGSDSNDGLAAGSGNAFATLQHALDVCATIDFGGYTVTIQLADGSYARADVPVMVGQGSADDLVIQGNTGDATAVVVDSSSSFVGAISCLAGAMCTVQYIKTTSSVSNGYDLYTEGAMTFNNVQFAGTQHHIVARYNAAIMRGNNYEIVGSAIQHIRCLDKGQFRIAGGTITLTGTPAFSSAFVFAHQLSEISFSGNSFSGSATGTRFSIQGNSFLQVGGDPDTILPGDAAGSTSTGGQYG